MVLENENARLREREQALMDAVSGRLTDCLCSRQKPHTYDAVLTYMFIAVYLTLCCRSRSCLIRTRT